MQTDISLPAAQSKPDRETLAGKKTLNKQKRGGRSVYLNEQLLATGISDKCCFRLCVAHPSICDSANILHQFLSG